MIHFGQKSGLQDDWGSVNITKVLLSRQYGCDVDRTFQSHLQTSRSLIQRLELETELVGHDGCVNCLEWTDNGGILASGSDDCHVMLWDPFRRKKLRDLPTPHQGNIFSVKFIPQTDDTKIVTGAGDKCIYGFDIHHDRPIFRCYCHNSRVKRLAVANSMPDVFWSASEDGRVFQFDMRAKHTCQSDENIVLLDMTLHAGRNAEVKCIAINPRRTELLAIGTDDGYARLYDRRMIELDKTRKDDGNEEFYRGPQIPRKGCVTYFAPGHFQKPPSLGTPPGAATYVAFSPNGSELLVNVGNEQIYLYDLYNTNTPEILDLPPFSAVQSNREAKRPKMMVSVEIDHMKLTGNELLDKEKYTEAINQYSLAIQKSPKYPALYLNRATALMKRKWRGDMYAALLDCKVALKLDPGYVKAQFRMARALLEMEYVHEAQKCLQEVRKRFPDYVNNHGVLMLNKDIESALEKKNINGTNGPEKKEFSDNEKYWRSCARDYQERYVGHCNIKTDIKEANFFGRDGKYIVAGSDDGNLFIWERPSGIICEILFGDKSILNCVQPHPYQCLLASSGIDQEIRLWSPQNMEVKQYQHRAIETVNIKKNQDRMLRPYDLDHFELDHLELGRITDSIPCNTS